MTRALLLFALLIVSGPAWSDDLDKNDKRAAETLGAAKACGWGTVEQRAAVRSLLLKTFKDELFYEEMQVEFDKIAEEISQKKCDLTGAESEFYSIYANAWDSFVKISDKLENSKKKVYSESDKAVVLMCREKHPADYALLEYCIKQQLAAKRRLGLD